MLRTAYLRLIVPALPALLLLLASAASPLRAEDPAIRPANWQDEEAAPALPELAAPETVEGPLFEGEMLVGEPTVIDSAVVDSDVPPPHAWEESPAFWARIFNTNAWVDQGSVYAQADFVLLHRTAPKANVVALDVSVPGAGTLDTDSSAFRIEPGTRVTLGRRLFRDAKNRDHSAELTYFGAFDWEYTDGLRSVDDNNLFTPLDPGFGLNPVLTATVGGFNTADTYDTVHSSNLSSFEINGRVRYRLGRDRMVMNPDGTWNRELAPGATPSFLYGFRVLTIDEAYSIRARRDGVDFADFGGNYQVDAENTLVGLQIGGDWVRREQHFSLAARLKAGGYVNFAFQESDITSNDTFNPGLTSLDVTRQASEQAMAFVAEMNFGATYHVSPTWGLRAGVDMMFVQGIAVASHQLDLDLGGPAHVDLSANAFYVGLSIGLQRQW